MTILDSETKAVETPEDHGDELRLWLRLLTCANLIEGGAGNDWLDGAGGFDIVSYAHAGAGVTVSLDLIGQQDTLGSGLDTVLNFEGIVGSAFMDTLSGYVESGGQCGKWRLANWLSDGSNKANVSGLIRTRLDRITGTKLLVILAPDAGTL